MNFILVLIVSIIETIKKTWWAIAILLFFGYPVYKIVVPEEKVLCKLYKIYRDSGMLYPEIVLTQDYLETGGFKSRIAIENYNTRGMKHNSRGFSLGKKNGHAYYNDVATGIADAVAWQQLMLASYSKVYGKSIYLNRSENDYIHFLGHLVINGKTYRYAEDTAYEKKLLILLPSIKRELTKCKCNPP